MRLARLVAALAAAALLRAEDADPARALALPAGSPQLAAMSQGWHGREGELLALLKDGQPARRRGAARLCAVAGIPPQDLLAAAVGCDDAEARRLAAAGLLGADLPPGDLLALEDARVVCDLLGAHPKADVLAVPKVRLWLMKRLGDAKDCEVAAALVVARGAVADWGDLLIGLLQKDKPEVVSAAHQALEQMTHEQVSLEAYAGDRVLLAKDWHDLVHRPRPATSAPAPEIAAAIADLPDENALITLLDRGPSVLPQVEAAMAGADRARRKDIAPAARLLERAVDSLLYGKLGAAGLEGMDAEDERVRLGALREAAAAVLERKDARGLLHLVSYADDPSSTVRAAAWDRLTRMSDEKSYFAGKWELGEQALFPPDAVLGRLRRSLRAGSPDEQVAALQFLATVEAKPLADDVAALLLAPSGMVVDAAIETLGHLDAEQEQSKPLLRLAQDAAQPASRRAKALELIAKANANSALVEPLTALAADPDRLVARAASRAAIAAERDTAAKRARIAKLAAAGDAQLAIDIAQQDADLKGALWPLLENPDAKIASAAAEALTPGNRWQRDRMKPRRDDLEHIDRALQRADEAAPAVAALALAWKRLPRDRAVAALDAAAGPAAAKLWEQLVEGSPLTLPAVRELLAIASARGLAGKPMRPHDLTLVIDLAARLACLEPRRLGLLAEHELTNLLEVEDTDWGSSGRTRTMTLKLAGGRAITLTSGDRGHWKAPADLADAPSADDLAALAVDLAALDVPSDARPVRDLAVAWIADADPAPGADAAMGPRDELWLALSWLRPGLRARVIAALSARRDLSPWELQRFYREGDPDLADLAIRIMARGDDSDARLAMSYLASLDRAALAPRLETLLTARPKLASVELTLVLRRAAPLPMPAALRLIDGDRLSAYVVAPFGDEQAQAVGEALRRLTAEQVLSCAGSLRRLRAAGPAVVDRLLRDLVRDGEPAAAAWLRTGMPLEAGLDDAYRQAFGSKDPQLWLVGAAYALKEGRLDAHGFMARVVELPPPAQGDAGLVAQRYLVGKLGDEGEALARVLGAVSSGGLRSWIPALPPIEPVAQALTKRVSDAATARVLGPLLGQRLNADREAWTPAIRTIAAAAGGQLDYLLPK